MTEIVGAISQRIARDFGGIFQPQPSTVAVGIAQVQAMLGNPNRASYTLTNVGTTNITLGFAPGLVSGSGILLLGNGATFTANWQEDADMVIYPIWAISDVAGGSLFIVESNMVVSPEQQAA